MEEIYWLQRLGNLNTAMWSIFIIDIICLIVSLSAFFVFYDSEYNEKEFKFTKKVLKWIAPIAFVTLCGGVFIPTTNEMYAIYGIGGTIDYLKENETAKQLPDKVINALDKWIDRLNEDGNK